jgi:hypothetical protein
MQKDDRVAKHIFGPNQLNDAAPCLMYFFGLMEWMPIGASASGNSVLDYYSCTAQQTSILRLLKIVAGEISESMLYLLSFQTGISISYTNLSTHYHLQIDS